MSLQPIFKMLRGRRTTVARDAAFSLMEVVVALAVLGGMSSGCYIGFNAINTYAVSTRLYSEAQAAAQNQIDLILSRAPFDVMVTPKKVPLELMTSSELAALSPALATSPPASSDKYYPYYRDSSGRLAKSAFVYTDPETGNVLVTGTLTTSVNEVGDSMTMEGVTTQLNTRRATVNVSYRFRSKTYVVAQDTLRTADR